MFLTGNDELDNLLWEAQERTFENSPGPFNRFQDGLPELATMDLETAAMLFGMIRRERPEMVLQTGAYRGVATAVLAQAMVDANVKGAQLLAVEPNETMRLEATNLAARCSVDQPVTFIGELQVDEDSPPCFDLAILGVHGHENLEKELQLYGPMVRPGGFLVLMDTFLMENRMGSDSWLEEMGWPRMSFTAGRGLDVFQNPPELQKVQEDPGQTEQQGYYLPTWPVPGPT